MLRAENFLNLKEISDVGMPLEKGVYTFERLVSGHICFEVPRYQRHYAWDVRQWEDLWNDLFYLDYPNKKHYFGTVILMKKPGYKRTVHGETFEQFEIVDGQQRIATTLILIKEIIRQLKQLETFPRDRVRRLEEDYLRYENIDKLELLGDDREFFRRYIIGEEEPPEILTPSQDRLIRAKQFFERKLKEVKKSLSPDEYQKWLMQLLNKIITMEMMVYPIEGTGEAARIFELANDRGKVLTNLEKTKSYLMYMTYLTAPKEEVERLLHDINVDFGRIFRWLMEIQRSEFGRELDEDDIQRYHFIVFADEEMLRIPPIFEYSYTRREAASLYLDILKGYIRRVYRSDKEKCLKTILSYVKDLTRAFSALKDILTYDKDDEVKEWLERIFLLRRVANFYPLLIACWIRFKNDKGKLINVLKLIEIMAFRVYAVVRRRPDAGSGALYNLAYEVHKGIISYHDLIRRLKDLIRNFASDWLFERSLRAPDFYEKRKRSTGDIRYLLYEYERFLRESCGERLEFTLREIFSRDKYGRPEYEIEHIWPQDPSLLGLSDEEKKEHEECVNKLGNLTLATKGWNRSIGNKPFSEKREKYKDSNLRVQRELASYETWGRKQIEEREDKIVKFALSRWSIDDED